MQLRTFLVAATIAATLGTIGCAPILAGAIVASSSGGGGGSGRGAPAGGAPTGVTIGPEGGSVTDRGVRIDVPPGAFTTPVTLSASFASSIVGPDETSVGRAVRLRPSMTFARGVTLELPWDSGLLPTGSSVNDVFVLWRDETTGLITTLGARVDGDVVRLTVFDFGTFEPAVYTGVDVSASSMIVATGSVPADGVSAVGVVVTLVDVGGQPMPGRIVQLAFDGPNPFGSPTATTNALGVALFQLSSTTVGTFSTTARVPPRDVALNQRVSITFTALAAVDPNLSTIAVAPTTTPLVGERITLTVTARGSAGQLLVGRSVVATATGGGHAIASAPNTDASGVSAFTFVASVTGPKTITVVVGGTTLTQQPVIDSRPQPEPADADTTTVVASPTSVEADGTTSSTITVTVRAADGTPLVGRAVAVAASGTGQVITQPGTTDVSGVATGTIASTVTGAKTITALVDGAITITQQPVVTFTIPPSTRTCRRSSSRRPAAPSRATPPRSPSPRARAAAWRSRDAPSSRPPAGAVTPSGRPRPRARTASRPSRSRRASPVPRRSRSPSTARPSPSSRSSTPSQRPTRTPRRPSRARPASPPTARRRAPSP